jgi:hypothetical protein
MSEIHYAITQLVATVYHAAERQIGFSIHGRADVTVRAIDDAVSMQLGFILMTETRFGRPDETGLDMTHRARKLVGFDVLMEDLYHARRTTPRRPRAV